MKNKLIFTLILSFITLFGNVYTQTQQVNHNVPFSSGDQNMWGNSWSAFSINMTTNLFNVNWNESFNTGNGGIVSILGQQFGAAVSGAFSGTLGSTFSLTGFTTGVVKVDYPIQVDVTMSNDLSYDQGDIVLIETDYTVEPGYALVTKYPTVGEAKLDLYFQLAGNLSATLCAFGCTTFPVIPSFNTGMNTINIFTANSSGIDFLSFNGGTPVHSQTLLPLTTDMLPGDPLGDYGISGSLTLPYVITDDYLAGDNLYACGDSTYVNFNVNIFDLIGGLNIPYVSAVAANLAGTFSFGPANINWNFFDAELDVNIHNKQCFDFSPKVYGKFQFPTAVEYRILSPIGALISQGTSAIINVQIGNNLEYKFPCYFEELNIIPTYSIDGRFTNHTYDSISFDFNMSAFSFGFNIPSIEITPAIHIPEVCIPIPYPCPSWSKPWKWCTKWVCTPAFTIPAIVFPGISFNIGPLWETSIPLGNIKYDWYKNTWSLEGFDEHSFAPFKMIASKLRVSIDYTNIACYGGNNGAIDITTHALSPATPYSYVWTNGSGTQDLTNLPAGAYEVEIYDANNCQLFIGATLTEPEQSINITHSKIDKLCNSGIDNGSIDVMVQGGTAPYSYNWNNGAITEDVYGLATGLYTLSVTDDHGCIETLDVTIEEPFTLNQVAALTNVGCKNDATGSINMNVSGGALPYTYLWSSGQTQSNINNLIAGVYTLTVTDANGCVDVQSYSINEPILDLNLTSTVTDVLCKDQATGAINITTNGGTSGYTYSWLNASGIVIPYQSEDISGVTAGVYTIIATDNNGCKAQLTTTINEPNARLQSNAILQHINCNAGATGQINPVITGGTPSYTYSWSDGSTGAILNNAVAGIHTLTIIDDHNCSTSFSYELIQPENPLTLDLIVTDVLCYGNNTGQVSSTISGGTSPYIYTWSNGSSNSTIQNLIAGNYSLTLMDAKGCSINDNINVNEPTSPLSVTSVITEVDCYGNNSGEVVLNVLGGTVPYSYLWSNSSSIIMTETTPIISNLVADTYNVVITDKNGCNITYLNTVDQPSASLTITEIIDDVNCYGMNDGSIDLTTTGGTAPYTFAWSNGAISEDISTILSGTYTATVTDTKGCVLVKDFVVNQPTHSLTATLNHIDVKCTNGNDGGITSSVTGGTAPYSYLWSNGSTTESLIGVSAGVYNLTVTDAQGCTSYTGTQVLEPTASLVVNLVVNDVQCYGASDGSIELNISGGVQPYYYNWGNQNEILLNNFSEIIGSLTQGNYFIRVTDRNGCKNEQYVQINQPQPIVVQYTVSDVLCYGDSTGTVDLTITGGTPNYSIVWDDGQTTEDAFNLFSDNHVVTITDAQLCNHSEAIFVAQPDELKVAYEIVEVGCVDNSDGAVFVALYGGVKPYQYNWSNGVVSPNNENLKPGTYALIVTDGNGCVANYSYEIAENDQECVFIPNTFTPNGDNYNDTWVIDNINLYPNAEIRVFNKWGNNVFESIGTYTPWEGRHHEKPLPSEVYYYIIVLGNNESNEYTGTITIIR